MSDARVPAAVFSGYDSGPMKHSRFPWQAIVGGALLAGAALSVDALLNDRVLRALWQPGVENVVGVLLGAGPVIVLLAILLSFPNGGRLCIGFLTPILIGTALLHLSKWAIGRARPRAGLGAFHFEPFSASGDFDSFPSGHAMSAATLALLLGIYFPRTRWVFYVIALAAGLERVASQWHFLSDVIAGYTLAAAVVFACVWGLGPTFYQRGSARLD